MSYQYILSETEQWLVLSIDLLHTGQRHHLLGITKRKHLACIKYYLKIYIYIINKIMMQYGLRNLSLITGRGGGLNNGKIAGPKLSALALKTG